MPFTADDRLAAAGLAEIQPAETRRCVCGAVFVAAYVAYSASLAYAWPCLLAMQQAGGQPRVPGAPQGEKQAGGQPGVTGAPQGAQQPGGQPRVPWAPQGAQQAGGRSMDDQEQQLEEWCRLLEFDTPMATAEEPEADEEPPMPPSPCPRFPCDTCFHTFATRGAAANHMRVCRAAEAERCAQALGSIPSLVETDKQERSTPREFGDEAWAGVTSWEWETFFSVEAVGGRTVRRIPQRARHRSEGADHRAVGCVLGGEVAGAVRLCHGGGAASSSPTFLHLL
ncbi:unnamed protein product [Closterium sp. Naga37s-1]|nr:unnamed protein product [Closterium sp. Naga37s-1]